MNEELLQRIEQIEEKVKSLESSTTIPYDIDQALRDRLGMSLYERVFGNGLKNAPLTAITAPSGGATADSQARTAINDIITTLETLGLVNPN